MHETWLFVRNVGFHWIAAMSSIVSFTLGAVEYFRDRKTEGWIFAAIALLFLMVAFDQAWQDEHRNSEVLIREKSDAIQEKSFWKDQSYQKDTSLRARDQLLEQNYTSLIGEQAVENKTEHSLAALSEKILDIDKPTQQRFTFRGSGWDPPSRQWKHYVAMFVMTNAPVQADLRITCQAEIQVIDASIAEGGPHFPTSVKQLLPNVWEIKIPSPQITPLNPLSVILGTDDAAGKQCQIEPI